MSDSGLNIQCKPDEFSRFTPPANQTCTQWASDFVNVAGGYLANPDATGQECLYCQYSVSMIVVGAMKRVLSDLFLGRGPVLHTAQH